MPLQLAAAAMAFVLGQTVILVLARDDSLRELVASDVITPQDAFAHATNKALFERAVARV